MSLTIVIGWTLNSRTRDDGPSSFDGYVPGMPQHEIGFTVEGFDHMDPSQVAESAFLAFNHPDPESFNPDTLASLMHQVAEDSGWHGSLIAPCPNTEDGGRHQWDTTMAAPGTHCEWCGVERPDLVGHYSLSVGDTVTVIADEQQSWGKRMMLACEPTGWRRVFPEEESCANCGRSIFQSGADNRWYHRVEGTAECPNRGQRGNAGFFPTFANPKATMIHIHQGGTLNAYCGAPLVLGTNVAWEDAHKATCPGCVAHFPNPDTHHQGGLNVLA